MSNVVVARRRAQWVAFAVPVAILVFLGAGGPAEGAGATRLAGADRIETAVEIAGDSYPAEGSAEAVVLARADDFADALAGTPLAVDRDGPVLITSSSSLSSPVAAEIERALGDDSSKTVYLLGGAAALTETVRQDVKRLGYQVQRLGGETRFDTATVIADELGDVNQYLITTGDAFPDALAAGPAAAATDSAVLLTPSERRVDVTDAYLDDRPDAKRFAIGGPAARAYDEAEGVFGKTREHTAVAVAERFFDTPPMVGLAQSGEFPDALTGGAHIGALTASTGESGPMLLTPTTRLAGPVADYLCGTDGVSDAAVYGGIAAISDPVAIAVETALDGRGCSDEDPPDARLTGTSVLHPFGAGLAHVGMTLHDVEHTTGTALEVREFTTFGGLCYHAQPEGVSGYSLMVFSPGNEAPEDPRDGVVARASSYGHEGPAAATHAGIRPGDTRGEVEAAYGADNLAESPHQYQPDGVYLDYHTHDGNNGLRFEVNGQDVVEAIHGGDREAITLPEGCA